MNIFRISRARVVRVISALVVVACLTAALVPMLNDVLNRHVLSVRIAGNFKHISHPELEAVVREQLRSTGFFSLDVDSVRRAALSLPWVRNVTVRRVWPDSVHIAVVERVAVARWNDDALLEEDASLFKPRAGVTDFALAHLSGPKGQHKRVLEQFKDLSQGLTSLAGGVAGLTLSERGQWEVRFSNGMTVVPSSPFDIAALMTFSRTLPAILGNDMPRVARIDLRYANGFAVRWREGDSPSQNQKDSVSNTGGVANADVKIAPRAVGRGNKG